MNKYDTITEIYKSNWFWAICKNVDYCHYEDLAHEIIVIMLSKDEEHINNIVNHKYYVACVAKRLRAKNTKKGYYYDNIFPIGQLLPIKPKVRQFIMDMGWLDNVFEINNIAEEKQIMYSILDDIENNISWYCQEKERKRKSINYEKFYAEYKKHLNVLQTGKNTKIDWRRVKKLIEEIKLKANTKYYELTA